MLPGVDNRVADLRSLDACHDAVRGIAHVYNLACDMGGMGFIEANRAACMISVLINTHLLMAGKDAGDRAALLRIVGVHLQRRPPAGRRRHGAPRGGRIPGAARGRVRLGEALLGAHVPALPRRLRHRDARRPLPQRLRAARHVRRRPREGAGRDLPEGRARAADGRRRDRDLGRRRADPELHVHRRLPLRDDADHGERHPRPDQPRLVRARDDQPARRHRRGDRRRPTEAPLRRSTHPRASADATRTTRCIRERLGWEPDTSLATGLERTYAWIHDQLAGPQLPACTPSARRVDAGGGACDRGARRS